MTRWGKRLAFGVTLLGAGLLTGCGVQIGSAGKGSLRIDSRSHDTIDVGDAFDNGFFTVDEKNTVTVVLIEGDPADPAAAMTIRMFWRPITGLTPIGRTATNASINYIVFGSSLSNRQPAGQTRQVGLYAGAGFLYINQSLNASRLKAGLWEANIQLKERSEDFTDQVGPSVLSGSVRAVRDDDRVAELIRQLGRQTSDHLGYPQMVRADAIDR